MKLIKPSTEILTPIDGVEILKTIERAARTCYKSEDKITEDSAQLFVSRLIKRGHEAMLEFFDITVKFICDRGVSHEIVRHRIASFAQESTRYCNYSKNKFDGQITFIIPEWFKGEDTHAIDHEIGGPTWLTSMAQAEEAYKDLISYGWSPQQARSVLPNSLKTEICVKMNLREWRHFFKLRTAQAAHPQMRELTIPLLAKFKQQIPIIFDDL